MDPWGYERSEGNVIVSTTGKLQGFGRDIYKWVSYLTRAERQAVREGELVVIWGAPTHGGNPPYRKVVFQDGRFVHRVPTPEEQNLIEKEREQNG